MSIVVPVGECQASLKWDVVSSPKVFSSTIGCRPDDAHPGLSPLTMLASIVDNATAAGGWCKSDFMATEFRFLGGSITYMDASGPITYEYNITEEGTGSGIQVAMNTAVLVTKLTGLGGRENRGRMYLPPIPAGFTVSANGAIGSGVDVLLQSQLEDWRTAVELDGVELVVHHSDGSAGTRIEGLRVPNIIGTQRRRIR